MRPASESEPPDDRPEAHYEMYWGSHTCHVGVVKVLEGLAKILPGHRPPVVSRTVAEGPEYLLRHHVHKRSHDLERVSRRSWKRLNFPLMPPTDVLEILGVFAKFGAAGHDDPVSPARGPSSHRR